MTRKVFFDHYYELCKKHGVDSNFAYVGYGEFVHRAQIVYDLSKVQCYDKQKTFAIKYINAFQWYIVWNLKSPHVARVNTLLLKDAEDAKSKGYNRVEHRIGTPNKDKEYVLVLSEKEFEIFLSAIKKSS